jgi:diguanylate cyclase (GGDEF)-like protein
MRPTVRTRRLTRAPAWVWYVGFGAAAVGLYYLLPVLQAPPLCRVAVYVLVSASAAVAIRVGIHTNRPAYRTPWLLLALGQTAYALGDFTFYLDRMVLHVDYYPFVDDAFYLTSYPLMAAGLLLFVRRRTPGWDLASAIDATIVAVGAGLVMWIYLMAPQLTDTTQSPFARAVSVAYPAMDLMLLTVLVRMVLGHDRAAVPHRMLNAWAGLVLCADLVYGYQELSGTYDVGNYLDLMWLSGVLLLGSAALHPQMRRLDEPVPVPDPYVGTGRLITLALASLLAPAVLYVQYLRHSQLHVPLVAAACACSFLLVVGRLKGMVETQRQAAITDPLTGLRTRRYLLEAMARHTGPGTGLLLMDLDHFKQINDSYGHPAGDAVLREVARRLHMAVRNGDVVARYGGEEFAVLLPRAAPDEIATLAERIRERLASVPLAAGDHWLVITASVGATVMHAGQSIDELVADADRALYLAKQSGRNRVVGPLPPVQAAGPVNA